MKSKFKTLFVALFLGSIWGFIEAVLGTVLHLPVIADTCGIWLSSTVVMVPIAYFLMSLCYTKTKNIRSVLYMGLVAAGIKSIVCLAFGLQFNPVLYIALESLAGAGAVAAIRPTKVMSLKGGLVALLGISSYAVAFIALKGNFEANIIKYALAAGYAVAITAVGYALSLTSIKMPKIEKFIYSPIAASVAVAVAVIASVACQVIA